MIGLDHPYFFLSRVFLKEGAKVHLSKYVYKEDCLFDERHEMAIDGTCLTEEWVNSQISSLGEGEELALHSKLKIGARTFHMPMIDFAAEGPLSENVIDRIRYFLPREVMLNLAFFDSGRSYHAYSLELLSPREWTRFMGRILLINPSGGEPIIDSRWVGHRLIGGYCSLRWSNNSGKYLKTPSAIQRFTVSSSGTSSSETGSPRPQPSMCLRVGTKAKVR